MTNLPLRPPLYRFHCWSDSDFAFKWILPPILSYREADLLQPIRSTTQIWAVTRHQYGISASVLQTSIWRGNRWWRREMSAVFSFSIIHYYQWWIQGRGPGDPAPHLIFDQNEAERAEKNFFGDRHPPPLATDYCIYFFCESLQETIMNITEVSEAAITVRGTFFPPGINKSDVFLS